MSGDGLLVCLIGTYRGGPRAWQSLIDKVLDPLKADLGLLGKQTREEQTLLFHRATHVWADVPEYDEWSEALDAFSSPPHIWRKFAALNSRSGLWGPVRLASTTNSSKLPGSGAVIFVLRMFLLERLAALAPQYSQFMLTRSDHFYACTHPRLPAEYIWVPQGEDYAPFSSVARKPLAFDSAKCITERHAIFPPRLASRVLSILPWFLTAEAFHSRVDAEGFYPNPECAMGAYWEAAGVWHRVRRYPRCMFTVRRVQVEMPKWDRQPQRCTIMPRLRGMGLAPKYCREHGTAARGCRLLLRQPDSGVWNYSTDESNITHHKHL